MNRVARRLRPVDKNGKKSWLFFVAVRSWVGNNVSRISLTGISRRSRSHLVYRGRKKREEGRITVWYRVELIALRIARPTEYFSWTPGLLSIYRRLSNVSRPPPRGASQARNVWGTNDLETPSTCDDRLVGASIQLLARELRSSYSKIQDLLGKLHLRAWSHLGMSRHMTRCTEKIL